MVFPSFHAPIRADLARMEAHLRASGEEDFPWLDEFLRYVLGATGKRIRPAITLHAGHLYTYDERLHIPMATGVELLHIASLVHDDLVDNAPLRRGRPTLNARWGNHVAVILGDYLLAKSAEMVASADNTRVAWLFAQTVRQLASGELREVHAAYDWEVGRRTYWERVARKSASLFSAAAQCGAILGGASEAEIAAFERFGRHLGLAFQVVDDILDFQGVEEEVGKPVGNDLAQGVLTLPAILYLDRHADGHVVPRDRSFWEEPERVAHLIELVRASPAIEEAYDAAYQHCQQARASLMALHSDGTHREALLDIVDFVVARTT